MTPYQFITILTLSSFLCTSLWAQSDLVDLDYGVNGVASTKEYIGNVNLTSQPNVDSQNRVYLSVATHNKRGDTITVLGYNFLRFDTNGRTETWGIETEKEISTSNGLVNVEYFSQTNDKILSRKLFVQGEESSFGLSRFDLDLNLEVSYTTENITFENLLDEFHFYPFYSEGNLSLDESNRLIFFLGDQIYRFRQNGQPDLAFGTEGISKVFEITDYVDRFYTNIYARLMVNEESITLSTTRFKNTLNNFSGIITRLNEDGSLDTEFGDNGYIDNPGAININSQYAEDTRVLYSHSLVTTNEDCEHLTNFRIDKLDKSGNPSQEFGNNGSLESRCIELTASQIIITGPQGELLIVDGKPEFNIDSTTVFGYNYQLIKYQSNGQIDSTFGNQGNVNADFIPGKIVLGFTKDSDYNIYLISRNNIDNSGTQTNNFFITKLRADRIWSEIPSTTIADPLNISILPNPSLGQPRVKNVGRTINNAQITLYDMSGRRISIKKLDTLAPNEEIVISNQDLSAGTYVVRVSELGGRSSLWEKVVVVE